MKTSLRISCMLALAVVFSVFAAPLAAASFGDDVKFLRAHTEVLVLTNPAGQAQVAVVPAWQGRVMTSSAAGETGSSYGWINRELIESGKTLPHMNPYGGEDRFWMGPEGGQFSIFFAKGAAFDLAHWQTPAIFDTQPFQVVSHTPDQAVLAAKFSLTNYSGTRFEIEVERRVRLLDAESVWQTLKVNPIAGVSLVAFASENQIRNAGTQPWRKETGLLSVWILGMFNPSPATTVVVPIRGGPEAELGAKVTSDYFGAVPPERLVVRDSVVFLSGDGRYRSKIGINPRRSRAIMGSYDSEHHVLTLVQFTQPAGATDYVNSLWKIQDRPFGGDVANSYNDGPPSPGAKPLGPFYELESSSPAAALAPGESLLHVHRTIHLSGPETALDGIARNVLGVSLDEIAHAIGHK